MVSNIEGIGRSKYRTYKDTSKRVPVDFLSLDVTALLRSTNERDDDPPSLNDCDWLVEQAVVWNARARRLWSVASAGTHGAAASPASAR